VSILLTQEERFARSNLVKLDNNLKNYFHFWGTNEWLGLRLEMIGTVVLSAGAFFLVVLPSTRVEAGKDSGVCMYLPFKQSLLILSRCKNKHRLISMQEIASSNLNAKISVVYFLDDLGYQRVAGPLHDCC
jgi:ATP-binding cassette subfamily C (CFTR/MRP) protein 2